jgi:hypothetical protein
MIRVYDINKFQQNLLDIMWELDSKEDLELWAKHLTPAMRRECETLEQLLMLSLIDSEVEKMDKFPEVMFWLHKIVQKKY